MEAAGAVWGADQIFHIPERVIRGQGLRLSHVQRGAPQVAGAENFLQGDQIHGGAPPGIEQDGARLHGLQALFVQNVDGFRRVGEDEGRHVGLGQPPVQLGDGVESVEGGGDRTDGTLEPPGPGAHGLAQPGDGGADVAGPHHPRCV